VFIILVLHVAQILKNHHGKCSVCCHGFRAYNTQKQLGQWVALIVLVLQATEIKKTHNDEHGVHGGGFKAWNYNIKKD